MKLERAREATKCYICGVDIKPGEIVSLLTTASGFHRVHPACRQKVVDEARKGGSAYQHPKGVNRAKHTRLSARVHKKS